MFGMGGSEIIVILIVALLFLGPDKLPQAAKTLSKGIRDIKKQSRSLQQQIESDEQIGGAIRDLKSALRGDEPRSIRPPPKDKKKPELGAPPGTGENTIHKPGDPGGPDDDAEAAQPADAVASEPPALAAPADKAFDWLPDAPAPPAREVTLPATAGEADDPGPGDDPDDQSLAAMIKPASGTVAKGS